MTQFYYIAASHELPTGSFGQKKTAMTLIHYVTHMNPAAKDHPFMQILLEKYPQSDKLMEIYETEEDAAGLFITGHITNQDSSHLFRHPLVYQVNSEGGSFHINDEIKQISLSSYKSNKKCLTELFDYLRLHMEIGEELELYSCWAQGRERFLETPKKELDLVLELSTFRLGNEFEWKDRQFIRVKK
ncbi:hypothetical protein [Paenibacillus sp. LHD-38]|uniref:hypothetical protein n=1 Tax=Paenibacillus sp. LHD-38 TaxID=3072143 RepID=UPI00280C6BE2|nr:hypothetical protein [Paenibacillus sp. LHD-38]MDQ8738065.1 hypothetical protein [Paenibacillus sp. LHD-38]